MAIRAFRGNKNPLAGHSQTLAPFYPFPDAFFFSTHPSDSKATGGEASGDRADDGCRGGGATVRRLAGARVHWKVNGPPSRCLSVVPEGDTYDSAKARVGIWPRAARSGLSDGGQHGKIGGNVPPPPVVLCVIYELC
jgi:hypothetical protein